MQENIYLEKINKKKVMHNKGRINNMFIFESVDGFVGIFKSPSKVINFCNKEYNTRCYKDSTSKKCFNIKERITQKFIGFVHPIVKEVDIK